MPHEINLGHPLVSPDQDAFNRQPFSIAMAERIVLLGNDQGAAIVGLHGKWGYGKSTILNFIKSHLISHHADKISILDFNPWLFMNQEELLTAFFEHLAAQLEIKDNARQTFSKALTKFNGALGMIPVVGAGAMKLAQQSGEYLKDTLHRQKELLDKVLNEKRQTIVVFIDDLDRLDRAEMMLMMKLVRLNANLPRMVYVLAFDDDMIASTIGTAYGGGIDAGRQFLEKIVQFPFAIPSVGHSRLVDYVVERARSACTLSGIELSDGEWKKFCELADKHLAARLTTPRQAVRFGAALNFILPTLIGEVDPLDLIVIEGLRMLFPEIHAWIRDNSNKFIDHPTKLPIAEVMKGASREASDAAIALVQFLHSSDRGWGRTNCGIRERLFINRYFEYSLRTHDISFVAYMQLVRSLEMENLSSATIVRFRELAQRSTTKLIVMLDRERLQWSEAVASDCARLVTSNGDAFGFDNHLYQDDRAAMVIRFILDLVLDIEPSGRSYEELQGFRENLLTELVQRANPLPLAFLLLDQVTCQIGHEIVNNMQTLIRCDVMATLTDELFRRLSESANQYTAYLFSRSYTDGSILLNRWRVSAGASFRAWMAQRFENNPEEALSLVEFLGPEGVKSIILEEWIDRSVFDHALRRCKAIASKTTDETWIVCVARDYLGSNGG